MERSASAPHAVGASSAQQPVAFVLVEELDVISPVLGASSTQSPVGCETLVVVSEDVGVSSTKLHVGWEKHVAVSSFSSARRQPNLNDPAGWDSAVQYTVNSEELGDS